MDNTREDQAEEQHHHQHDHSHAHHHGHGHAHHHHHSDNILVKLATVLHLPGFAHDHSHAELAGDRAFLDNQLAIRTVWIALVALGLTTALQIVIYAASGSVALLADTVHNLGDALNSAPLLIAFYFACRLANRRYTYGYGRLEDIAGIFIVISIGFSAAYILVESVQRLFNPRELENLEWVALAALVGFVGNELVALMQIRVGRRIGSDAMIADGQHALIDGLTSLAVLIAVIGALIGLPILDPIVGIVIAFAIVGITWNAIKAVWYRIMDAVDPHLVEHVEAHVQGIEGVAEIETLRMRWVGHRMYGVLKLRVAPGTTLDQSQAIVAMAQREAGHVIPQLDELTVQVVTD
ncbi:MAG: cation diffusion facilitator family transporter [Chloroflexi bacterium]|nr:cation diffusion facilitator family transporter [Chloroflexota bacterium]